MIVWPVASLPLAAATLAPFSALATLFMLPLVGVFPWKQLSTQRIGWLMLGWLVWLPVSLIWSLSPGLSLPQMAVLVCLPLGWIAGVTLYARGELDVLLERLLPWLLLFLTAWGFLLGPDSSTGKPQGPFNDPNAYVAVINLLLLPVLSRYLDADLAAQKVWSRTAQLALLAGAAFVLFLTASRGATLALLVVLPFVLWLAHSKPAFVRKLLLIGTVVLMAYLAAVLVTGGQSNVALRLAGTVESGDSARLMLMHSAWLMIQDHLWLGTGLGTFRLIYPQYRFPEEISTAGGWVHNDYLQLWQEAGLPMLLLLIGITVWVIRVGWQTLRVNDGQALLRMGYLAGIGAILLHAMTNFLFYFALVSLLVGLYLARVATSITLTSNMDGNEKQIRPVRMAAWGYVFILGFLIFGQLALEGMLGGARYIQRGLLFFDMAYPRYQVAYWLSVLAPFHPLPRQVMGQELAEGYLLSGGNNVMMRDEALARMEEGWQRAPCYLPYGNDALALLRQGTLGESAQERGEAIVVRNLACNARHGLSYYHAGLLALPRSEAEALEWWRAGLLATPLLVDRLLLAAAITSLTVPGHEKEMARLAARMAESVRTWESNLGMPVDTAIWDEAQYRLRRFAGKSLLEQLPQLGPTTDQDNLISKPRS